MLPLDPSQLFADETPEVRERRPWLIIFADLTCLLVSFFVLLNTVSKIEHEKTRHALQSLEGSRAFGRGEGMGLVMPRPPTEAFLGPAAVRDHLASRVRSDFPAARMDQLPSDTTLRFSLSVSVVFDGATLRPAVFALLSEIAAAVRQGAPGFRFEVETALGKGAGGRAETDATAKAIAAASALARELVARGAPKALVAAGLDQGDEDEIRITIRARPDDEPRIDFSQMGG